MRRMGMFGWTGLAVALALAGAARPGSADEVVSKGTTLRGKVSALTSSCVELKPEYGDGVLKIKWKDIEDLHTDGSMQILYGDDHEVYAGVEALRDGKLEVKGAEAIDPSTIFLALPLADGEPRFTDRVRSAFRYWDGNFDLGFNTAQSTVDTTGLIVALGTTRTKGPTRYAFGASYRYGTQTKDGEKTTTQKEAKGMARGEYDITPSIYGFASTDLEYDKIENINLRAVPKAGLGYTIWQEKIDETHKDFLRAEAGGAYVYEDYLNDTATKDFFSVAFGAVAQYNLPFGSRFDWRFDYLPAVSDWTSNYLIRTQGDLLVPMLDPLSLKISVGDDYNNHPPDDTKKNSLYASVGVSVTW